MTEITVILLGPANVELLDRVAEDVFDHPVDPSLACDFAADPRHHMAVAVDDGVVVGMASGVHYLHPDKAPELWINEVGVTPTHHRMGLGRRLIDALFAHGRALGCHTAWVLTEQDNAAALALYARVGGKRERPDPVLFEFDIEGEVGDG